MATTNTPKAPSSGTWVVQSASGGRVVAVSLADPQFRVLVSALQARVTEDSASSKAFLKSVGIMNKSGKTARSFGG